MGHKRKGQLTVDGEWGKHMDPFWGRVFWKGERRAASRQFPATYTNLSEILKGLADVSSEVDHLDIWLEDPLIYRGEEVSVEFAIDLLADHLRASDMQSTKRVEKTSGTLISLARVRSQGSNMDLEKAK